MDDMGFAGDGDLALKFKINENTDWILRGEYNKVIRRQRMVNEWDFCYLNNKHRIFLGRWPYGDDLFPIAYKTAAMLAN